MSSNRKSKSPASASVQIPPLPSDSNGIYSSPLDQHLNELTSKSKKFVKVSGKSENEIEPDRIQFCIKITSSKLDLKESRNSVKKREDYVLAVLKKLAIKDKDIKSNEMVSKNVEDSYAVGEEEEPYIQNNNENMVKSSPNQKQHQPPQPAPQSKCMYTVNKELNVTVDCLSKYLQILSICTEKLDFRVVLSEAIVNFTSELMDKATENVLQAAVNNARKKAEHLISSNNKRIVHSSSSPSSISTTVSQLGPIIYTIEDYLTIENFPDQSTPSDSANTTTFESLKWKKFNKNIKCQITSVYEIVSSERSRKAII